MPGPIDREGNLKATSAKASTRLKKDVYVLKV